MSSLYEFLSKGGPVMVPIVGGSVATVAIAIDRAFFWMQLLRLEEKIVHDVLEAARYDLGKAANIAEQASHLPIGRFLLAPLKLNHPTPETFRLALESAGDREFVKMRVGDKLLETIVAVSPLLGLLGTVTGLIATFTNLNIGGAGGTSEQATKAAAGIGEALITTAGGMIVAIMALLVLRLMVSLQARQIDYFSSVGNDLELIYRQFWYEPATSDLSFMANTANSGLQSEADSVSFLVSTSAGNPEPYSVDQ